jgi:hypothetical protein
VAHARQAIRQAVRDRLLWRTAAADRVFASRMTPWGKTQLPGIAIYATQETAGARTLRGPEVSPEATERVLRLAVLGIVAATEGVDDAMDALALEIEGLMVEPLADGVAAEATLVETSIEIVEDQETPYGGIRLTYDVVYFT